MAGMFEATVHQAIEQCTSPTWVQFAEKEMAAFLFAHAVEQSFTLMCCIS